MSFQAIRAGDHLPAAAPGCETCRGRGAARVMWRGWTPCPSCRPAAFVGWVREGAKRFGSSRAARRWAAAFQLAAAR